MKMKGTQKIVPCGCRAVIWHAGVAEVAEADRTTQTQANQLKSARTSTIGKTHQVSLGEISILSLAAHPYNGSVVQRFRARSGGVSEHRKTSFYINPNPN